MQTCTEDLVGDRIVDIGEAGISFTRDAGIANPFMFRFRRNCPFDRRVEKGKQDGFELKSSMAGFLVGVVAYSSRCARYFNINSAHVVVPCIGRETR